MPIWQPNSFEHKENYVDFIRYAPAPAHAHAHAHTHTKKMLFCVYHDCHYCKVSCLRWVVVEWIRMVGTHRQGYYVWGDTNGYHAKDIAIGVDS